MTESGRFEMLVEGAEVGLGDQNPLTVISKATVTLVRTSESPNTTLVVRLPRLTKDEAQAALAAIAAGDETLTPQMRLAALFWEPEVVVRETRDGVELPPREPEPDDDYIVRQWTFAGDIGPLLEITPESPIVIPREDDPGGNFPLITFSSWPGEDAVLFAARLDNQTPINVRLPRSEIARFQEPGPALITLGDPDAELWQIIGVITGASVTEDSSETELANALAGIDATGQVQLDKQLSYLKSELTPAQRTALATLIANQPASFSALPFTAILQLARGIVRDSGGN